MHAAQHRTLIANPSKADSLSQRSTTTSRQRSPQNLNHQLMALSFRQFQRCPAVTVPGLRIGPGPEQHPHGTRMPLLRRHVQGRHAFTGLRLGVRPGPEQHLHGTRMPLPRSHVQGRPAFTVLRFRIGTGLEQHLHGTRMLLQRGPV